MGYIIVLTKQAQKDAQKLESCNLDKKAKELLKIIKENPCKATEKPASIAIRTITIIKSSTT